MDRGHQQSRPRSRERDSVLARFDRIRAERRGGKSFKRRYRSPRLKLLTYFIDALLRLLDLPDFDIYSPENQPLVRRIDQAREVRDRALSSISGCR